jgi:hypothetical protein
MKIICIILSILLSSTLYAQQRADSKYFSWDSKNNKMIFYSCNCNISTNFITGHKDDPYRNHIESFPYLGINMLAHQTNILSDQYSKNYWNKTYYWEYMGGLETSYLNINHETFLPKGEFEYYSIKSKNDKQTVFIISDTSNQSHVKLSLNKEISCNYVTPHYPKVAYGDDAGINFDSIDYAKKIFDSCLVQLPEYFLFGCYVRHNSNKINNRHHIINTIHDRNSHYFWDADYCNKRRTDYIMSRLVYQNDSIQQYLKTAINYFPAQNAPQAPYQASKNIQRFSPIIGKNISKQFASKQLTKNISFEDIEAVNDDKVLITNTLDDLGRVKKQTYTYGEDFWKAQVTLIHNYGIDTDTMRHYVCYPHRVIALDTVLVMTAIYKNKKLISLHQNLLEQYLKEYYYKKYFAYTTQVYPVLPAHNLTYQVFYNEAGDVKQIIMPNITFSRDLIAAPYYNCNLQPYDICILNFEYGDYDAKGNWQTVTVVGAKGEDQNEECGYKEVFSRKIKYKENP